MGYQALLFCPDEKLARVVSQVFSELEFTIDLVNEPFTAVKRMMAQRFDAVVVDFTDEQNTALLFKSARNSSFNQSSLAIALVEGQAGVAKAYRIGANLVLTKPINIEQAKGTLRVARGLLRKSADPAGVSTPAPAPSVPPVTAAAPAPAIAPAPARVAAPVSMPARHVETPKFETPLPVVAASAKIEHPVAPAAPVVHATSPMTAEVPAANSDPASQPEKIEAPKPVIQSVPAASTITSGSAAAPAPAREPDVTVVKEIDAGKKTEKPAAELTPMVHAESAAVTAKPSDAPSFAGLDNAGASGSAGGKKFAIAAVILVAVGAAGYFGWTKFSGTHTTVTPQSAAVAPQQGVVPAPGPITATPTQVSPSEASATNRANGKESTSAPGASSAPSTPASTPRASASPAPEVVKPAPTPIQVNSGTTRVKPRSQPVEEPAPQAPNPLAVAAANGTELNGLISSPSSGAKPVLARMKVSQGVVQGLLIKKVAPKYPASALATHTRGAVQIEATISKEGNVVNPKVLSGDPTLAAAALDAVRQWRYKPYYLDGEPVEIQTQIRINFGGNN